MPVLINKQSGLAEDLAQAQAQVAAQAGTHEIPLNDAEGNPVVAPASDVQALLASGHALPSTEQLGSLLHHAKYATTEQQVKTTAEGALSGALPFGIGAGAERLMGVKPEDIQGRKEINPRLHTAGEVAGLAGSMFVPGGQGSVLAHAGEEAIALARLTEASKLTKAMVKGAVETSMMQVGTEAEKAFLGDPAQSAETIIGHLGLAALFGAGGGAVMRGLGAAAEKSAPKLEGFLQSIKRKVQETAAKSVGPEAEAGLAAEAKASGQAFDPFTHEKVSSAIDKAVDREAQTAKFDPFTKKPLEAPKQAQVASEAVPAPQPTQSPLEGLISTPEALGAVMSVLFGHGAVGGAIAGRISKFVGGKALEYAKPALARYLISDSPFSPAGFKALYDSSAAAQQGIKALQEGAKAVFKGGVIAATASAADTKRIDEAVNKAKVDPSFLGDSTGHVGYYLPDHATEMGAVTARAMQYLANAQPNTDPAAPMDPQRQPSAPEDAAYNRTRNLVSQPLSLLKHLQQGTLTPSDVQAVKTVYPVLYSAMAQQVLSEAIGHREAGKTIPYHVKVGMSLMLGQPLDSSMTAQSIAANSAAAAPMGPQIQQSSAPRPAPSKAGAKSPAMYQTPTQARERVKSQ